MHSRPLSSSPVSCAWNTKPLRESAETKASEPQQPVVATIGGGVNNAHQDFQNRVIDGVSFTDSPWYEDTSGQGTHMAAVIAEGSPNPDPGNGAFTSDVMPIGVLIDAESAINMRSTTIVVGAVDSTLPENPDLTTEQAKAETSNSIPAYIAK